MFEMPDHLSQFNFKASIACQSFQFTRKHNQRQIKMAEYDLSNEAKERQCNAFCNLFIRDAMNSSCFRNDKEGDCCPICLGDIQMGVRTDCGHVFCGECLANWHMQTGDDVFTMTCPMCRRDVFHTNSYLSSEELNTTDPENMELRMAVLRWAAEYIFWRYDEINQEENQWW